MSEVHKLDEGAQNTDFVRAIENALEEIVVTIETPEQAFLAYRIFSEQVTARLELRQHAPHPPVQDRDNPEATSAPPREGKPLMDSSSTRQAAIDGGNPENEIAPAHRIGSAVYHEAAFWVLAAGGLGSAVAAMFGLAPVWIGFLIGAGVVYFGSAAILAAHV